VGRAFRCCLAAGLIALLPAASRAESVQILLNAPWQPYHAPLLVAREHGDFARAGVEPVFTTGSSSANTTVMVGQRSYDIGVVDVAVAAAGIGNNVQAKVVAIYQHQSGMAFVGIRDRVKLDRPQSLIGLKVGTTPGGTEGMALGLFRRANGLAASSFSVDTLDRGDRLAALTGRRIDALTGDGPELTARLRGAGIEPVALPMAKFGVHLMGHGIIASNEMLTRSPALVTAVLRAFRDGMAEAAADPAAACALLSATTPQAEDDKVCVAQLTAALALSDPPGAPGWGRQSAAEWTTLVETLRNAGAITNTRPAATYYTNAVLPP
jgi:NitT/TauT family transport system substrate-binding protein